MVGMRPQSNFSHLKAYDDRLERLAVLKPIAQGRGQETERRVRSCHAAWLKARRPAHAHAPATPRRSVAELRELAKSAAAVRLEREAKERAKQKRPNAAGSVKPICDS